MYQAVACDAAFLCVMALRASGARQFFLPHAPPRPMHALVRAPPTHLQNTYRRGGHVSALQPVTPPLVRTSRGIPTLPTAPSLDDTHIDGCWVDIGCPTLYDGAIVPGAVRTCEAQGLEMPAEMVDGLTQSLDPAAYSVMRSLAGVDTATPQAAPTALWVIGSSGSGKSSAVNHPQMRSLLASFGFRPAGAGRAEKNAKWDAAVIDGSYFREVHPGFVNSRQDGQARGCVWAGAWGNE